MLQPYKQRDIELEGEKGVRLKDKPEVITISGFYEHVEIFITPPLSKESYFEFQNSLFQELFRAFWQVKNHNDVAYLAS